MTTSNEMSETECVERVFRMLPQRPKNGQSIEGLVRDMHAFKLPFNFIVYIASREVLYQRPWPTLTTEQPDEINVSDTEPSQSDQRAPDEESASNKADIDAHVPTHEESEVPPRFKEEFDAVRWADIVAELDAAYPSLDIGEWKKLFGAFLHDPKMSMKDVFSTITPPEKRRTHSMR